jgi:hypothetical protein
VKRPAGESMWNEVAESRREARVTSNCWSLT